MTGRQSSQKSHSLKLEGCNIHNEGRGSGHFEAP